MKKLAYLLSLFALTACHNGNHKQLISDTVKRDTTTSFKPYQLNKDYIVIDTGIFDATVMGGSYAVVTRSGKLADTIDKYYGIEKIGNDNYLYLTITGTGPGEDDTSKTQKSQKSISGSLGSYIMVVNGKKQNLSAFITDFNDYFSSPSVINGNIYFWQIKKIDTTGNNSISAAKYDPVTKKTTNYYLVDDYIETDDANYFSAPYFKNDTIYFDGENKKLRKFTKDFKPYN
ncbi:hypothetical protein [Mucilaginibacter sp. R-33]|uniref:hypothetical protein n=1 Tax=Mucilaginibacter sp. R-33 TaxID=3416711 RepID=UPI003CEBD35A